MKRSSRRIGALIAVVLLVLTLTASCVVSFAAPDPEEITPVSVNASQVTVDVDGEQVEYDLTDEEGAASYVDNYADNLTNDKQFENNIQTAIAKVRENIKAYA